MQLCLVLLGSVLALGWILGRAWLLLECDVRAVGEPSGTWAMAVGVAAGPFALAGVAGSDRVSHLEVRAFGRRLPKLRSRSARSREEKEPTPSQAPSPMAASGAELWRQRFGRLKDHGEFLLSLRHHLKSEPIGIDLVYGFRDVALTGRVLGALAAFSGVLPAPVELWQTPLWSGPERWEARTSGRLRIRLCLVIGELLWYMLKRRQKPPSSRSETNGKNQHL